MYINRGLFFGGGGKERKLTRLGLFLAPDVTKYRVEHTLRRRYCESQLNCVTSREILS